MHYFDSDVVFNYIVIQDPVKNKQANELLLNALEYDHFVISTLVIQEIGYALARFELGNDIIRQELDYLNSLNIAIIDNFHITRALELAEIIGFKHINDCVHTAVAESLDCELFYTYNKSDFKRIQKYTSLQIVIL